MSEKLCLFERRIKILDFLRTHRYAKTKELAQEFNVSSHTILRDIVHLSCIAPICTKSGGGGGIFMMTDYRRYSLYLTDDEESFLYLIMDKMDENEKKVINRIITKFTKNTAFNNK